MTKDMADYYSKELIKTAKDKYNSNEEIHFDSNNYHRIVHSSHNYAPKENELISSYIPKINLDYDFALKRANQKHIDGPKGPWYAHRDPMGCIICDPLEMCQILISVLKYLSIKYPKISI